MKLHCMLYHSKYEKNSERSPVKRTPIEHNALNKN